MVQASQAAGVEGLTLQIAVLTRSCLGHDACNTDTDFSVF